jgi:hypothetical protein
MPGSTSRFALLCSIDEVQYGMDTFKKGPISFPCTSESGANFSGSPIGPWVASDVELGSEKTWPSNRNEGRTGDRASEGSVDVVGLLPTNHPLDGLRPVLLAGRGQVASGR